MRAEHTVAADSTAVRVALWRVLHVQVDPPPHVLRDEIGLRLAAPDEGWRSRPDMDPRGTSGYEMLALAREAGFTEVRHVSTADLSQRCFTGRTDSLRPASGAAVQVAST